MSIKKLLSNTILSIGVVSLLTGCGGSDEGSSNINNNGTVSTSGLIAQALYDGSWRYTVTGNLNVSLGSNVSQLNITGLKVKIGNQPEQTVPFNYVVMKSTDGVTQEIVPLTAINVAGDYIPENEPRTMTITPVGNAVGGSSFVGNPTTVSIGNFLAQELLSAKPYTLTFTQSKEIISPFGESNVGIQLTLKNELGVIDNTSRLRIVSPSSVEGLNYSSDFTTNRVLNISFPENKTSGPLNYQFSVELESISTSEGVSKALTNETIILFQQASTQGTAPFTISSNSGTENVIGSLPNITSSGSFLIDLDLLNSNYNGNTVQLDIFDMTSGGSLPIYRDYEYNISDEQQISFLINKENSEYWPTNSEIKNNSVNDRELLVEIKIIDGSGVRYKYTQLITQAGDVVVSSDERTLSMVSIEEDLTRYKNTLGKTTGYFALGGIYPPFQNTDDEFKDYSFAAQILDPAGIVDLSQTFLGGVQWNSITSNNSLMNFNNNTITLPNSNTIKFDIAFNDTTSLLSNKEVSVLFFGEDGNVLEYKIPVLASEEPIVDRDQYNLTQSTSQINIGPDLPSSSSLFFSMQNTTGIQNNPILNLKLLSNKDYVNLTGGAVENTTTEKSITVPFNSATFVDVGVEQLLANSTSTNIAIPYISYITVDDKIVSNIIDGSSINVLPESSPSVPTYTVEAALPTDITPGDTGSITYSFNLDSGIAPESTPMFHIQTLNNGDYLSGLPALNLTQESGSVSIVAAANATGANIPVNVVYYVTVDGKAASELQTAVINVLPNP